MLLHIFWFVLGLICLIAGAQSLVRGASRLALAIGISPMVVGLTIVAFGTSSPEIAVSVGAVLEGSDDIAVGNVVGSNIFNVLFILGLSAIIAPLVVQVQMIRQEVPVMIVITLLLILMSMDGRLERVESLLLVVLLASYTTFLVVQSRRQSRVAAEMEGPKATPDLPAPANWDRPVAVQIGLILFGLVLLVIGSQWLVESAVIFARAWGVSDVIIGLTIIAAGTSMPEVATSVVAALKGERDIAVGNVIGSNIFNILACLGISGFISAGGLSVPPSVLAFDFWVMLAVSFACLPIFLSGREIARWEGFLLLGYYVAYAAYLILAAKSHDALPLYSSIMLLFVVPITVVTLVVSLWGSHREVKG